MPAPPDGPDGPETRSADGDGIVRRRIDPDPTTTEFDFLSVVAELEGVEPEELPSLYDQVDHFLATLFQDPPAAEAQISLQFSYAGYRIAIDQDGGMELVKVGAPA